MDATEEIWAAEVKILGKLRKFLSENISQEIFKDIEEIIDRQSKSNQTLAKEKAALNERLNEAQLKLRNSKQEVQKLQAELQKLQAELQLTSGIFQQRALFYAVVRRQTKTKKTVKPKSRGKRTDGVKTDQVHRSEKKQATSDI